MKTETTITRKPPLPAVRSPEIDVHAWCGCGASRISECRRDDARRLIAERVTVERETDRVIVERVFEIPDRGKKVA